MSEFKYEAQLAKFSGPTRLERLLSYYRTWKLPKHPSDSHLFSLMLEIVTGQEKLNGLFRLGNSFDIETEKAGWVRIKNNLLNLNVSSEWDQSIKEHCIAHCDILQEIYRSAQYLEKFR